MDNVTITPHLGYVTFETLRAFYTDTLEALVAYVDGAPIRVANPDALAHPSSANDKDPSLPFHTDVCARRILLLIADSC